MGIINAIMGKLRSEARRVRRFFRRAFASILNRDDILHWPRVYTTEWHAWLQRLGVQHLPRLTPGQIESGYLKIIARYENVPEDRALFPLGILRWGCQPYLGFLILHAMADGSISLDDIAGFHEAITSMKSQSHPMGITYLNQPDWQGRFPRALREDQSWKDLLGWVGSNYGIRNIDFSVRPNLLEGIQQADVQVVGHFGYPSGLEVATRAVVSALESAGMCVGMRQISAHPKDPPHAMAYRALIEARQTIVVMSPEPYFADWARRAGVCLPGNHKTIAIWYWELSEVPSHWKELAQHAAEIWAPTRFIQQALGRVVNVPVVPMLPAVTLISFDRLPRANFQIPEKGFVFLFIFDLASVMERKNPLGLIRAFKRAFAPSEDVILVLKVTRSQQYPAEMERIRTEAMDPRILLIQEDMPRKKLLALMSLCDAYVSLHRSEGFGLTMAEAMLMGKPVIATAYSGNMDFMDAKTALLVPYKRVALEEDHPPYRKGDHWAEPDLEAAALFMRRLWQDPLEAKALGEAGRKLVSVLLSPEEAGRRMVERLRG